MYYQNYEDYMRSVLGYPTNNQNTYETDYYNEYINDEQNRGEIEELYPEIYKKLKPFIEDACSKCSNPITKEILENMVDEIYSKVEDINEINININVVNDSQINNTRQSQNRGGINQRSVEERETRQRRPNNQFLRDLIKILLLNKLIGNRPPRPQYPGGPRPPMPPPRPRGEFDDYLRF